MHIEARVARGPQKGQVVYPTKNGDGTYTVSKTRFASDYVYVTSLEDVSRYIASGYGVRMDNPPTVVGPRLFKNVVIVR